MMVIVFAGNHGQYSDFLKQHRLNPKYFKYAFDVSTVLGVERHTPYITIGTYYEHDNWIDFQNWILVREFDPTPIEAILMARDIMDAEKKHAGSPL